MSDQELMQSWWQLRMQMGRLMQARHHKGQGTGLRGRDRIIGLVGYAGTSLSQRELADRVHLKPGSLTEALNGLEADGYVQRTRDPFDRRILRVQLTAKGQTRAKEIKAEHDQFVAQLFAQITPADTAVLQRILQQMIENVKTYDAQNRDAKGDDHA